MTSSKNPESAGPASKSRKVAAEPGEALRKLKDLSGSKVLDRIQSNDSLRAMVGRLPEEDFFWLVKKVGDDDCLPLLQVASNAQLQYLLDLELWHKDRLDQEHASKWLKRLSEADTRKLARWLFSEGLALAFCYLLNNIEIVTTDSREESQEVPPGYFSVDGIFHIRVHNAAYRHTIEHLLRVMAAESYDRYQYLLMGLGGVVPAELEEEMYRMRSVRLAEHGFLPFEEAISIYAPLGPDAVHGTGAEPPPELQLEPEPLSLVPVLPFYHSGDQNLLTQVMDTVSEQPFADRVHMEFAGLCNQILSAEGKRVEDIDTLISVCRRASGYLNVALERLSGKDISAAEQILRKNGLPSLFRVGFGLALKLRWQAERWLRESWFRRKGLEIQFWEDPWAGTLSGLLAKRPLFYTESEGDGAFRDFHRVSELGQCLQVLRRLMVVDGLLEKIFAACPVDEPLMASPEVTYRPLLFTLWARKVLGLEERIAPLTPDQARRFFTCIHEKNTSVTAGTEITGETFVRDLMAYVPDADDEARGSLEETLTVIWNQVADEYGTISPDRLDPRYATFLWITTAHEAAPR